MSFTWKPGKTHDSIWDEYFMGIALLCEERSKDVIRQVGACVVNDEPRVIGMGYNGMPLDCHDRLMPWKTKVKGTRTRKVKEKHYYVCHAELNAIVNKDPKSVAGCTLYVTLAPCNECAKIIIRSGIKKVIYLSDEKRDKNAFKAGKLMLEIPGIECISFARCFTNRKLPPNRLIKLEHEDEKEEEEEGEEEEEEEIMAGACKRIKRSGDSTARPNLTWEQYFMALAQLTAKVRSRPEAKQGACIVNQDKRIVGLGYVKINPIPTGKKMIGGEKLYVSHAPVNAIVNESPSSLRGCTMYVTHFPCKECAKVIVQSGISKIVHLQEAKERIEVVLKKEDKDKNAKDRVIEAAIRMFDIAHIELVLYKEIGTPAEIFLDYNKWA